MTTTLLIIAFGFAVIWLWRRAAIRRRNRQTALQSPFERLQAFPAVEEPDCSGNLEDWIAEYEEMIAEFTRLNRQHAQTAPVGSTTSPPLPKPSPPKPTPLRPSRRKSSVRSSVAAAPSGSAADASLSARTKSTSRIRRPVAPKSPREKSPREESHSQLAECTLRENNHRPGTAPSLSHSAILAPPSPAAPPLPSPGKPNTTRSIGIALLRFAAYLLIRPAIPLFKAPSLFFASFFQRRRSPGPSSGHLSDAQLRRAA